MLRRGYSKIMILVLVLLMLLGSIGWFGYAQYKNRSVAFFGKAVDVAPVGEELRDDLHTLIDMADYVLKTDGKERVFLILLQNNMELRPGGGYVGSFGILKIKDGQLVEFVSHDSNVFDGRIPSTVEPPYPMKETLKIDSWKFRDANWSPDFATNAKQAEYFYYLGGGEERFDGVVAITTNMLATFLRATGPITLPGYDGEYNAENAALGLERQVELGYQEQGVSHAERKSVIMPLAYAILDRIKEMSVSQQYDLFRAILEDIHRKDVQLSFRDEWLQSQVERSRWDGKVDDSWSGDYVMISDANLAAWKSDYYVKRSAEYTVDFAFGEKPKAMLAITYNHTAKEKDWMTNDYQTYVRVYTPKGSWLESIENKGTEPKFGEEFGKKYFGVLAHARVGQSKTVTFRYDLPSSITEENYRLKIQKQAGVNGMPVSIRLIRKDGSIENRSITLDRDTELSFD